MVEHSLRRGSSVGTRWRRIGQRDFCLAIELLESRRLLTVSLATAMLAADPQAATQQIVQPTFERLATGLNLLPQANDGPAALTAPELRQAYGINQILFPKSSGPAVHGTGAGETIAIIDAYDDPDIAGDLQAFDAAMGLSNPPSFRRVAQDGSSNLPPTDPAGPGVNNWEYEIALDVEFAHAVAPKANILLVEANSPSLNDLLTAVSYASAQPGVAVVSMSWGTGEFDGESSLDSVFTTPGGHAGVTFVAATGDSGEPGEWPAYSPNVLAVGGTTLTVDSTTSDYISESGWGGGGGGISTQETQPVFQNGVVTQSSTQRTIPDVSFDADPDSGVYVYDTYNNSPSTPWDIIGGTSLAAPSWSGLVAIADQGRATASLPALDGVSQVLPELYGMPAAAFHDVTSGNNGFAAGPGYDLVTGIGTPVANTLIPDLAALAVTSSTPSAGGLVFGTAPTTFSFTFNAPVAAGSGVAAALTVDGQHPDSAVVNGSSVSFTFNTSPVQTQGLQTMSIAAGSLTRAVDGGPVTAYSTTFRYGVEQLQVSATVPANGAVASLPLTTLQVQFNQPYAATLLSPSNLTLSEGTVSGASQVNATTVQYTLSGVTNEEILAVTMAAGALTDDYGNPMAAYSGTISLNYPGVVPYPASLGSVAPLGSLVYGANTSGLINFPGDTDSFTLSVNAGQTLSVGVTPAAGLQPALSLAGPGGTVASVSATAAGSSVLLQTVPITTSGTYTITLSGLAGTSGGFNMLASLNAALENGAYGGATESTMATAQDLSPSLLSLANGASREAVIGGLSPGGANADAWFSFSMSAGDTITLDAADLDGTSDLSLELRNSAGAAVAGAGIASINQLITDFTAPASGVYYAHVFGASADTTYNLVLTRNADLDNLNNNSLATAQPLLSASQHGVQTALGQVVATVPVETFESDSLAPYTFTGLGEASLTSTAAHDGSLGLSLAPTDWMYRDDAAAQVSQGEVISVWVRSEQTAPDGRAYFGFGASSSGTLSVVMAGNTGQFLLQDNSDFGFTDIASANQTWQADHWYRMQITWGIDGTIVGQLYDSDGVTLLNTITANDTSITSGGIAFRSIDSNTTDFDSVSVVGAPTPTYSVSLNAGGLLLASTATPGAGSGLPNNTLDAEILLYNAAGTLVASDDNSAPDGRNASLSYLVPAGASGTYYLQVEASPLTSEPTAGDYVLTVSLPPTLSAIPNPATLGTGSPAQTVALSGIGAGANAQNPSLTVTASSNNTALIPNPTINYTSPSAAGTLNFTPVTNATGSAVITVSVQDNGGAASSGNITTQSFTVTVAPNQAPSFTAGPNQTGTAGTSQTVPGWATNVSAGPSDESGQSLTFQTVVEPTWYGYGGNAQHTADSSVPAQSLQTIHWSTPVDLDPQYSGSELLIHYGEPMATAANTIITPVKTGASGGFELEAIRGTTGAEMWTLTTDYTLPPSVGWTSSFPATLTPTNRLYFAGAGGSVYYVDDPDATNPGQPEQLVFYGASNLASYSASVSICTPITSDAAGNIYFGFICTSPGALGLTSGFARIAPDGTATYTSAEVASGGDASITKPVYNAAPALSNDGTKLYAVVSTTTGWGTGYLVELNALTLAPIAHVALVDPATGAPSKLPDQGTASPLVGPDGDVYFGVLDTPFASNNDRGWLLHFSGDLSQEKTPGAFGWDDTPSVVPASMVPSYTGTSTYLLMSKYNNYADFGEQNGLNEIAILDPNATEPDPLNPSGGPKVMNEVLTIAGVTPDPDYPSPAVKEWCINSAVVDPGTDSIYAGSEDGKLYRWCLGTNTFMQVVTLTSGIGEAYTPTLIGPDGTVYAISNATLFAVGASDPPLPRTGVLSGTPTIDPTTGTLQYTLLPNAEGVATVAVDLHDNGGTANGGVDTSPVQTFTITANEPPTLNAIANTTIAENSGAQSVDLAGIGPGVNVNHQPLSIVAISSNPSLIPNPTVTYTSPNTTGTLSYSPLTNAFGSALITVTVQDSGGIPGGGDLFTFVRTFTVIVEPPLVTVSGVPTGYTAGAAPKTVDAGITVSDANADLAGATISITDMQIGDALHFTNTGTITGTPSTNGSVYTLTLSGSDTVADYQAALESITFSNPTNNSTATRTISFTVTDGTATSLTATKQINVSSPAEIIGVYLSGTVPGSVWTTPFDNYLAANGLGNVATPSLGFALQTGAGQLTNIPWTNVNTISVQFNESVSVVAGLLTTALSGNSGATAPPGTTVTYNDATHVATFTLPGTKVLSANTYMLTIPTGSVLDGNGAGLDGAFTNHSTTLTGQAFPSGLGTGVDSNADFNFLFNVLPGAAKRGPFVLGADSTFVRNQLGEGTIATDGTPAFASPYADVNGQSFILGAAVTATRNALGDGLPTGTPPSPPVEPADVSEPVVSTDADSLPSAAAPTVAPSVVVQPVVVQPVVVPSVVVQPVVVPSVVVQPDVALVSIALPPVVPPAAPASLVVQPTVAQPTVTPITATQTTVAQSPAGTQAAVTVAQLTAVPVGVVQPVVSTLVAEPVIAGLVVAQHILAEPIIVPPDATQPSDVQKGAVRNAQNHVAPRPATPVASAAPAVATAPGAASPRPTNNLLLSIAQSIDAQSGIPQTTIDQISVAQNGLAQIVNVASTGSAARTSTEPTATRLPAPAAGLPRSKSTYQSAVDSAICEFDLSDILSADFA